MEDSFVKFALAAVGMVASGTVAGLIKVWFDLYNFKLHVTENYVSEKKLEKALDAALEPVNRGIEHLQSSYDQMLRGFNTMLRKLNPTALDDE